MGTFGDWAKIGGNFLGGLLDDDGGGDRKTVTEAKVQPRTDSTASMSDFDIMYNASSVESMRNFADQMGRWVERDQNFLANTYQPFQSQVIDTNTKILPHLTATTTKTLEENARDLVRNDTLKTFLRDKAQTGDTGMQNALAKFEEHLATVPDEQTRVGQALTSVESQFGEIGKQLTRDYQSRGQTVSQSSKRDLLMQKAKAKAGAADAAAEAARLEKGAALQAGLEAQTGVNKAAAEQRGADVASLTTLQESQQAGLETPQVGGVQPVTGYEGASIQSGVEVSSGTQEFGTRSKQDQVSQTQKGIKMPTLTSGATGQVPNQTVTSGVQGEPARDSAGNLITAGGKTLGNVMNTMTGIVQGVANPR